MSAVIWCVRIAMQVSLGLEAEPVFRTKCMSVDTCFNTEVFHLCIDILNVYTAWLRLSVEHFINTKLHMHNILRLHTHIVISSFDIYAIRSNYASLVLFAKYKYCTIGSATFASGNKASSFTKPESTGNLAGGEKGNLGKLDTIE